MRRVIVGCSGSFPAAKGDEWTVKGIGGEPNERWTVNHVRSAGTKENENRRELVCDVQEFTL